MAGENDFCVLEARDRIGGRVQTKEGIDFGATWFNDGHSSLLNLIDHLKVGKYRQFNKGKSYFVYSSMAAAQEFEANQEDPPIYRAKGGTISILKQLAKEVKDKIQLNQFVESIEEEGDKLKITTRDRIYVVDKVIVTIPPKLASGLSYTPALAKELLEVMQHTHTWMSNAIKVGICFKKPFWREKGQSGTLIGQAGAIIELYDHCNFEENSFALMGFVNESLRELDFEEQKRTILNYLKKYFGHEIEGYLSFELKDWSTELFTACLELKSLYMSPHYGHDVFQKYYMNNKLIFSGAETSKVHGGYLEGAVYSGLAAAQKIIKQ